MTRALTRLINIGLVLFLVIFFAAEARAEVAAPKIIKLNVNAANGVAVTGVAPAGSEVLIYLDGNFIGQTDTVIKDKAEPSFSFQYQPAEKLAEGRHALMVIARDKTSLVLSAPSSEVKFSLEAIPAPTLLKPEAGSIIGQNNQLVTGLTKSGTKVSLYLNNVLLSKTEILQHDSGTANFSFKNNLSLGQHKLYVMAEDANQKTSQPSPTFEFKIELPLPAPTMFAPVVNKNTTQNRPFIVGLAKNDSTIKVYLDNKLNGEFTVKNHQSGTANFAYRPLVALARGRHLVYAVAIDRRGKTSIKSNQLDFAVKRSAIAQAVQEIRQDAVARIKESEALAVTPPLVISESVGTVEPKAEIKSSQPQPPAPETEPGVAAETKAEVAAKEQAVKQELADKEKQASEKIKNLIGADTEKTKNDRGIVDEGRENQGKLKLSLVLFILFLVGVVAWLLWVNRELVKERRTQNEAEADKAEKDKNDPMAGGQTDKLL